MTSAARKLPDRMTVSEFLAWRSGDGARYELVEGVPRMQDPASDAHGTIQLRLGTLIANHLERTRPQCRVVANPGIAPRLRTNWNYREPELGVTCTPNRGDVHMLPDPILLVEVLSPSNTDATWSNIALYATVPSVQEILIVNSTVIDVQLLRRLPDGSWPQEAETFGRGGTVQLASIDLAIAVRSIYRQTHLATEA